jgi:uncharacterized OB-fold protein
MGTTATRFFNVLRTEGRLSARRCPACQRALVPPRANCDRCFVETEEWVACGDSGILEAFTIVAQSFVGLPEAPYCFGYVRPDGADTAILNYIRGIDLTDIDRAAAQLAVGAPMKIAFASTRQGQMSDFWFEPTLDAFASK